MQVEEIEVGKLIPDEMNPNEMDDRSFNALCESIQEEGWIEPIQVVPNVIDDGVVDGYFIVGGHHRAKAAEVLGMEKVPAVVLDPKKFDEDRRQWNLVKLNVLRGKLNPEKFARLYEDLTKRYDSEVVKTLMGFTSEDAFKRLYKDVKRQLPPEMREKLDSVADEIKTIDDLSTVLNRLFAEYGETLPSNMMVFSWGGKEVLWVRCSDAVWKGMKEIADDVAKKGGDINDALEELLFELD